MSKILKIIGIVFIALLIIFMIAGFLLTKLVDPNQYKEKISQEIFQSTGRQLTIKGDMAWSFFPWLGLKVNDVNLSNLPSFGNGNIATVKHADIKIGLLSLFIGKVDINNITLNDLQLNLIKNRSGQGNWENPQTNTTSTVSTKKSSKGPIDLEVSNVDISGGNISWRNDQTGDNLVLNNIAIQGQDIGFNNPFRISISANVTGVQPKINASILIVGSFDIDSNFSQFSLSDIKAQINNLEITGKLAGSPKNYSGNINISQFNLKAWLKSLSLADLNTAESSALTNFKGIIEFKGDNDTINFTKIALQLDQSNLTGTAGIENFSSPAVRFKLNLDQLNADNYLPKNSDAPQASKANANSTQNQAIPIDAFKKLNINGSINVGKFTFMRLNATQANLVLTAQNGLIKLNPVKANLYQGNTTTYLTYDVRPSVPSLQITSTLNAVQMQPLLKDFMNLNNISGLSDFSMSISASGTTPIRIMQTMNGKGQFSLTKGKIVGINLDYQIDRAQALLSKSTQPSKPSSNDTDIGLAKGSFSINNGVVTNNDLQVQTGSLNATGKGSINLPNQSIDYTLYLMAVNSNSLKGQKIPFRISGPFSNLNYQLDIDTLIASVAKQQVQNQLNKLAQNKNLRTNLGANEQKLLSGLFS